MNRTELAQRVADSTNKTVVASKEFSEATLDAIKLGLETDGEVRLAGFGIFKVHTRKERIGRNPSTGESITIPEKQVVKFKPYF